MHAKRVILCIDDDEVYLSVLKVLIQTWGYKAIIASLRARPREGYDLVLARQPIRDFPPTEIREELFPCPLLWLPPLYEPAWLRERVRIQLVRKRGPKPKPPQNISKEKVCSTGARG